MLTKEPFHYDYFMKQYGMIEQQQFEKDIVMLLVSDDEDNHSPTVCARLPLPITPVPNSKRKKHPPPLLKNLGVDYIPGTFDVICGRGNVSRNHNGNVNYRTIIERHLPSYLDTKTKTDKSIVVSRIVKSILQEGGNFIRQEDSTGEWHQVSDRALREKVGQSLRDALHTKYRSSTKAKKERKKVENVQQHEDLTHLLGPDSIMLRLANDIKKDTPDFEAAKMFNAANIALLEELKRRLAKGNGGSQPLTTWSNRQRNI